MRVPALSDIAPTSPLLIWVQHYCRLGYEVSLSCREPADPSPLCQRLVVRRQVLWEAMQQHLQHYYALSEPHAQRLFAQWGREVFAHLLAQGTMQQLSLETALALILCHH